MLRHSGVRRPVRRRLAAGAALGAVLAAGACDFLDPTNVENPRTTADDLARAREPTAALLPGLRAQFARVISSTSVIFEVVSDNYSIHGTGLDSQLDDVRTITPVMVNATGFATGAYWNLQELRALTSFVIDAIAPGDATATADQVAEALYYRGMGNVIQGESFSAAPVERDGTPVPAAELLQRGIADLQASIQRSGSGPFAIRARAGIARANRALGNAAAATQAAQQVLATNTEFLYQQMFDATSIENGPHIFLVTRALKEMQPLPRLDFLDPRYTSRAAGIAVSKAEEMHLILAEAALAAGDIAAGRGHLVHAVERAAARPRVTFTDNDERRNADLTFRPRSAAIQVRADANSPYRAGLVLDRPGQPLQVPTVAATSLRADSVAALTDSEAVWHAFHLARQEILLLEGRRMSDLGIRLPMMLREIDANPNIREGDAGTVVVVPSWIPSGNQMDLFSPATPYDAEGNLLNDRVTILHDLNRTMARERISPFR